VVFSIFIGKMAAIVSQGEQATSPGNFGVVLPRENISPVPK